MAGFGKNTRLVEDYSGKDSRIEFAGTLDADEPPRFAQRCDVMINPRLDAYGNRYSFPSKLLEYGLAGRAILSARMSGVDEMLGPDAFYFAPQNFKPDLHKALQVISVQPRPELRRRGIRDEDYGDLYADQRRRAGLRGHGDGAGASVSAGTGL